MKGITDCRLLITLLCIILFSALFFDRVEALTWEEDFAETDRNVEQTRLAWNEFLTKKCEAGQTDETIRALMHGKYRDNGLARGNSGIYSLLFLIDDFHQVEFLFDHNSQLMFTPWIEPKGEWLRTPSGDVRVVLSAAEMKSKSKAAGVALEFVMKHTNHKRGSLSVFCRRSADRHTWDVVVVPNMLQLDSPTYNLKVTNDGQVSEMR